MAITKLNASVDLLNDVDTTTAAPADKEVLAWDSSTSQWEPLENNFVEEAPTSGLVYGRANGTWIEVTGGEGGGGTGGAGSINLAYDKLTPDGTADTFDLTLGGDAREPLGATNLLVSVNGVIQEPGVAFTTAGSTITFTEVPQTDDVIDFIVELTNGSHWELNGVNLEYAGEGTKVVVDQLQANGDAVFMGNVGIGTDLPAHPLVVDGDVQFKNGQVIASGSVVDATTPTYTFGGQMSKVGMYLSGNSELSFATSGEQRLTIGSTGNVGIGTEPTYRLDVDSDTDIMGRFTSSGGATAVIGGDANVVYLGGAEGGANSINIYESLNLLRFYTDTTERMRIDASGKVGIGTPNPSAPLEIQDDSAKLILRDTRTAATGVGGVMRFQGNTNGLGGANTFAEIKGVKADGSVGGEFVVRTSDTTGSLQERMRISASGNVGIGEDIPVAKLHVDNGGSGDLLNLTGQLGSITSSKFGNGFSFSRPDSNYISATGSGANLQISVATFIKFDTNGSEAMRIDADGYITSTGNFKANSLETASGNVYRPGYSGIHFSNDFWAPLDSNQSLTASQVDLGADSYRFKHGHFNGNVYSNGSPLTRTRDLIETLSTLRKATMDETVDVRQALASACDKLIEKFEAMQNEVSTMPAGDES